MEGAGRACPTDADLDSSQPLVGWRGGWARRRARRSSRLSAGGDRTGLEWDLLPANANVDGQATADGAAAAGNGACWSSSLDYTAGNNCTAGEQLLQCVVAASGNTIMYNYCVTSMPGCAEMADESSCQTQCNAGEYGVQCGQSTVPVSFGCRIVYPSPPMGAEGLAFCCTCN